MKRLFAFLLFASPVAACLAADSNDINQLGLEVEALQTLAQLQLDPSQLKALAKLAQGTASSQERKPAKASAQYVAALKELRTALIDGDADTIDELNEKVDKLREKEKPQVDDKVQMTEAAKKRAAEALNLLTLRQTVEFLANFGEALPDPVERIKNMVEESARLDGKKWDAARDKAAEEVAWLVAGFDADKGRKVREQTATLLNKLHDKATDEGEVEKEARAICAGVSPIDVMRHIVEHDLAELLSNPALPAAIKAHLKK